jgi:outer membrane lipoprotein-sorting protein
LKKAVLFVFTLVLSLSFMVGSASAATQLNAKIDKVLGVRYLWAGTTTKGFDCSGFTRYIFSQFDIDLSHSSKGQSSEGEKVAKSDLKAGDLVFFNTGGAGISHVGIYVGDGYFVHSANKAGVTKSKLSEKYYAKRYVTARRVLSDEAFIKITTDKEDKIVKPVQDDKAVKIDKETDKQTEVDPEIDQETTQNY